MTRWLGLLLLSICPLLAGERVLYLQEEMETPGFFGKAGTISQVESWIAGDKYRKDEQEASQTLLVRSDLGKIWRVNHSDSTYQEIPAEVFQGMALMGMMMFGVTMDSLTGKPLVPDPLFEQTTRRRRIGEWQTVEMIPAKRGDGSMSQMVKSLILWVSRDCGIDAGVYANISRKMMGPFVTDYEPVFQQMQQIGGYPVLIETRMMGRNARQELLYYETRTVDEGHFDLPEGYEIVESEMMEY